MARYIDAERLEEHFDYCSIESRNNCDEWGAKCFEMARNAAKNQPTADVAPRSEVEELIAEFDEMVDLISAMTGLNVLGYGGKFARLRKKYTEEKDDEQKN